MSYFFASGAPAAASYHASGFSGDDRLDRDGGLTGIADGNDWTISFWFKMTGGDGVAQYVFMFGDQAVTNPFYVIKNGDNSFSVIGKTAAFATIFIIPTQSTFVSSGATWHHFFASSDGTTFNMFIDGVDNKAVTAVEASGDVPFTYIPGDWSIGAAVDNAAPMQMKISEFWFDDSYISSPSGFRNGTRPADDLSGLVTPRVYFHDPAATFGNNSGSGGNFNVKVGTLTDQDADLP